MNNKLNSSIITLRDVIEEDLPVFFRHQLDAEANHMAAFVAKNPEDKDAFMLHRARIRSEKNVMNKTIILQGQIAGHIASFLDDSFGKREVTYWIGREYWGRGIATNALTEFLLLETSLPIYAGLRRITMVQFEC